MNYRAKFFGVILLFVVGLQAQKNPALVKVKSGAPAEKILATEEKRSIVTTGDTRLVELPEMERYQLFISQLNNIIALNQRTYTKGQAAWRHAGVVTSGLVSGMAVALISACVVGGLGSCFAAFGGSLSEKLNIKQHEVIKGNLLLLALMAALFVLAPINTFFFHSLTWVLKPLFFGRNKNISPQIMQYFLQTTTEDACPKELQPLVKSIRQQIFDNEGKKTGLSAKENIVLVKLLIACAGILLKLPSDDRFAFDIKDLQAKPTQWKCFLNLLKNSTPKTSFFVQLIRKLISYPKLLAGALSTIISLLAIVVIVFLCIFDSILRHTMDTQKGLYKIILSVFSLIGIGAFLGGFVFSGVIPLFIPLILNKLKSKFVPQQKIDQKTLLSVVENYKSDEYEVPPFIAKLLESLKKNESSLNLSDEKASNVLRVLTEWAKLEIKRKPAKVVAVKA